MSDERAPEPTKVRLDDAQEAALAAGLAGGAVVLGAPGSGKTTLAEQALLRARAAGRDALLLAPSRSRATDLRERLSPYVGTVGGPIARTVVSLAYDLLVRVHRADEQPAPVLVTGPEQDAILADLIEGQLRHDAPPIDWGGMVPADTLTLRAFRAEVRDVMMRCAEFGIDPDDLAELATRRGRPLWRPVAELYRQYRSVLIMRSLGAADAAPAYDSSEVVDASIGALEALAELGEAPTWDLIVVDDAQEATAAAWRLYRALADGGARLLLIGDTDVSAEGFRGAQPVLLGRACEPAPTGLGLPRFELAGSYRVRGQIAAALERTIAHIRPAGGVAHRLDAAGGQRFAGRVVERLTAESTDAGPHVPRRRRGPKEPVGSVRVAVAGSASAQSALVARWLRDAHLSDGVPWCECAVVARSAAEVEAMRDHLALAGIPVAVPGAQVPIASEPAVRPFLLLLRWLADTSGTHAEPPPLGAAMTPELAETLLSSPLGGADPAALRRLRRALRASELSAGGTRASDELLVDAICAPGGLDLIEPEIAEPAKRLARVLSAGRAAASRPAARAGEVLWALWDASGLAGPWEAAARGRGPAAKRAGRDLDALVALFHVAAVFAERQPTSGISSFVDHLGAQDLPSDRIAAQAPAGPAVTVTTATASIGHEWRRVAVVSVQDGAWPDLRLRDSLLGAQLITDIALGRWADGPRDLVEARRAVLDDELRVFALAISRASEQLFVTAIVGEDDRPSEFVSLIDQDAQLERPTEIGEQAPLDLASLVALARRDVCDAPPDLAAEAAGLLAELARAKVPGAHPREWYGLNPPLRERSVWPEGAAVPLSPSRLELLLTCPLRWMLETSGGHDAAGQPQALGTLVHRVAQTLPNGTAQQLASEFERLWPSLGLPEGWLTRREHDRAGQMVERLAAYIAAHPEVTATEQDFRIEAPGLRVSGRVDRVEASDAGAIIVDFKTAKTPIPIQAAASNPQLTIYQLAAATGALGGKSSGGARLVYLGAGKSAAIREQGPMDDAGRAAASDTLAEAARLARGPRFDAHASEACRTCPVRGSCPLTDEGGVVTR